MEPQMAAKGVRVYCAGPLFNAKEQEEMGELAAVLDTAGYDTFLPQRDGLELTRVVESLVDRGMEPHEASDLCAKAIFALDVYQVMVDCQAIVVNLNGRVPDEGAVSEAALAWCSGKAAVAYKADSRSVFLGNDNPLVTGLFNFEICSSFEEVLQKLQEELRKHQTDLTRRTQRNQEIAAYLALGSRIWEAAHEKADSQSIADILMTEAMGSGAKRAENAVADAS
jgi:nucleoside 2-deoxyribosyltransferase